MNDFLKYNRDVYSITGYIPNSWKTVLILLIFKPKNNPGLFDSYRPL